jgi:hypothetical protein
MSEIIDFDYILKRDFKNLDYFFNRNLEIEALIHNIFDWFVSFDDMTSQINCKKRGIVIIDTCSFILHDLEHFNDQNVIYIITCGVFLEILQGFNKSTSNSGTFKEDLEKLIKLKHLLQQNLIFLRLGRKMRAYWEGYQPSQSCRKCFNNDQPHHKILRDVDTEILRVAHILKASIDTLDTTLQKRIIKIYRRIKF